MPIYEYQVKKGCEGCKYCKDSFTIGQRITDAPLKECPKRVGWSDTGYDTKK